MKDASGVPLTLSDYKPVQWSSEVEWIAQTRAVEATVDKLTESPHTRPNGKSSNSCTYKGVYGCGGNLAWEQSDILEGIETWYAEKSNWTGSTKGQTGHYLNLITPWYSSIGIGCFRLSTEDKYTVAYEVLPDYLYQGSSTKQIGVSGLYKQVIEIGSHRAAMYEPYNRNNTTPKDETQKAETPTVENPKAESQKAETTTVTKPKATSISKLTASKKQFTVKWKKVTGVTGYQIQYSTNKSFKKSATKSVTVKKASTVSKKITKLAGNKKYYVRIRTYKTTNGKNYYSSWSKTKTVKTKK